jgi:Ca2+-binding RTX toxin-like protein
LYGGTANGNDTLFGGGGGNDVMLGGASGHDTMIAGSGNDTMFDGGAQEVFAFFNGMSGGADAIGSFVQGRDYIALEGYGSDADANALATAVVSNGSTTLSLPDGTTITILGVSDLGASSLV